MGGAVSQPVQLVPGPGFEKRKANTIPGYEQYDFGGYEIWGPYKKTMGPGFLGGISWQDAPMNKVVDGVLVLDNCNGIESKLKPQSDGSLAGTLLRSYTSFNTKPDVGTDKPACYADNLTLFSGDKDDGLFYIHYKHPVFARMMTSGAIPKAGFSGLIPTLLSAKKINSAKSSANLRNMALQRPTPSSFQNFAETAFLGYKASKKASSLGEPTLPLGIKGPLDNAVMIINQKTAIFNFGQKRTLNGGKRKHLRKRGTRRHR